MHAHKQCFISFFFDPLHAPQAPSQVANVSLSKAVRMGKPILIVTWTTPHSDVTISRYEVQYRRNGTTSWGNELSISDSPLPTSYILIRLVGGTEYNVIVRAVSDAGVGNWSVEQTERTFDSKFIFIIYCYQLHLYLWCIIFFYYSNNCLFCVVL